jgi:hypothetical protein
MNFRPRQNILISQRVAVALVYKKMLGIKEARDYLLRENVPDNIAERVLCTGRRRHVFDTKPQYAAPSPPPVGCRRRNHIHDAIIEASLKIEGKLGEDWARTLLNNENVPDEVIERVLGRGPRQLRAKRSGASPLLAARNDRSSSNDFSEI